MAPPRFLPRMSSTPSSAPLDVLIVPHTHWDREWYHGAGRFRQRLVALVDELLDDDADVPFLLDGQGIVLDDYVAMRPPRGWPTAASKPGHGTSSPTSSYRRVKRSFATSSPVGARWPHSAPR